MSEAAKIAAQESDGGSSQKAERGADAGFLWDFWYPVARSSAIQGRRLATTMLLEVPLVLGRTDAGKPFAMRDSCPHRGYRFPMEDSTGRIWSAVITGGSLMGAAGNAWRFHL